MLSLPLSAALEFIEKYNINLIQLIFIGFTTVIVVFGSLITLVESKLPACIRQSFRYGKHSYKGKQDVVVQRLEVPKKWFAHFYIFAFPWSLLALVLILKGFVFHVQASEWLMELLDLVAGGRKNRKVQVDSTSALIAMVLMTLQCARRFYETNFIQIFSKNSKINLSHYLVGYLHYFGAILAILANAEGFVRGTTPTSFSFAKISFPQYVFVFIFHFAWTQQWKANMILVNLRKDKTGQNVTEQHLLPKSGFFTLISSPHMFFEILMYVTLIGLMPRCITWYWVTLWVLSNQVVNALLTHQWYKKTFKNYSPNRRAIIPFIL